MSASDLKIGVIGTGYWGKNHVRVFSGLKTDGIIDSLEICDIDTDRAKELARNFDVGYTTNYRELDVDAVSIVTPSATHYEIAKEFLEDGKDVFIEKPMTLDSKEADKLVRIADKNDRILMAGLIFRYHPAVRGLKKRLDRGEFGKPLSFYCNRHAYAIPRRDMGVLFALGIHEVDLLPYLLDMESPREITAVTSSHLQEGIEETALIIMEFEGGTKGFVLESWMMPGVGKKRELVLVGSEKSARIDYLRPQELEIFDIRIKRVEELFTVEDTQVVKIPIGYKEPLREELIHFVECLKSRSKPQTDGVVGARAVKMIEAAMESARRKKTIVL